MDEIVHTHEFLIGFRLLLENQQEKKESPAWANDDDDVGKQSLEEKSYLMKESASEFKNIFSSHLFGFGTTVSKEAFHLSHSTLSMNETTLEWNFNQAVSCRLLNEMETFSTLKFTP